jgi:hypothetical protein
MWESLFQCGLCSHDIPPYVFILGPIRGCLDDPNREDHGKSGQSEFPQKYFSRERKQANHFYIFDFQAF